MFYIVRTPQGQPVPLIPADEIPYTVRLDGVPRVLSWEHTSGMRHVATLPYACTFFKQEVEGAKSHSPLPASHAANASDVDVRFSSPYTYASHPNLHHTTSLSGKGYAQRPAMSLATTSNNWRQPLHEHDTQTPKAQAVIDAILSSKSDTPGRSHPSISQLPPSGTRPDQNKKEFCTYWIRTGECGYAQQGCLYKHEMPERAMLEKIGFKHTPRWWLEKQSATKIGAAQARKTLSGARPLPEDWLHCRRTVSRASSTTAGSVSDDEEKSEFTSEKSDAASKQSNAYRKDVRCESVSSATGGIDSTKTARTATKLSEESTIQTHDTSGVDDLIDFISLFPTPPTSAASPKPLQSPLDSMDSSSRSPSTRPRVPVDSETGDDTFKRRSVKKKIRVFIPNGESTEHHIAEAKSKSYSPKSNHSEVERRHHRSRHTEQDG